MNTITRLKQIDNLSMFLKEKQSIFDHVLEQLDWKKDSLNTEEMVLCQFDPNHWVPRKSLEGHLEMCQWVGKGYSREELEKEPPASGFFYEKSSEVLHVSIDAETQQRILSESGHLDTDPNEKVDVPQTMDRYIAQFTPSQRLAFYEHVLKVGKATEKTRNVTLEDLMIDFEKKDEDHEKPKTKLEILAEQRDYKRRRQSYRAKNVHITKKSYTEIMKEVIENQTSYLAETASGENSRRDSDDSKKYETRRHYEESEHSSRHGRRHSEYGEGSRHHHRSPKRKKHKRDRSRSRSSSRHKKSHHKHKKSHY